MLKAAEWFSAELVTGKATGSINNYCPCKETALSNIVVSLTCTAYHWGALIA